MRSRRARRSARVTRSRSGGSRRAARGRQPPSGGSCRCAQRLFWRAARGRMVGSRETRPQENARDRRNGAEDRNGQDFDDHAGCGLEGEDRKDRETKDDEEGEPCRDGCRATPVVPDEPDTGQGYQRDGEGEVERVDGARRETEVRYGSRQSAAGDGAGDLAEPQHREEARDGDEEPAGDSPREREPGRDVEDPVVNGEDGQEERPRRKTEDGDV